MEQTTSRFSANRSCESACTRCALRSDETFSTWTSGVSRGRNSAASGSIQRALSYIRTAPVSVGHTSSTAWDSDSAAAICACATAIGPSLRLDGLFSLLRRTVQVGAGLMLALFAGILKVQGMLGASFDSAAVKTARFAVDKLVPAVGGGIADAMDAAISSVLLIQNAVGVTGMLVIVAACAAPILQLGATLFAMRLARAVAQPVADNALLDAVERFCDVIQLLIVLCMAAMTLGLILAGAAIGAGRSIAS